MTKRLPAQPKANLGTYFLAKNSRLFRPGAELILATARTASASAPGGQNGKSTPKGGWRKQ